MPDPCTIIGLIGMLGVVVMVVGHAMWLIVAAIFRGLSGSRGRCTICGAEWSGGGACPRCRFSAVPRFNPPETIHRDVQAAGEADVFVPEVQRLCDEGYIDEDTVDRVLKARARSLAGERVGAIPADSDAPPVVPSVDRQFALPPPLPVVSLPAFAPAQAAPSVRDVPSIPVEPPAPPPEPRRPFSEVLAAFMEQKNIRWGELAAGLLIIGCASALVAAGWGWIAAHPAAKYAIFTAATAAVFGAGLYMQHRWHLPTTSRGILLFACLLVPLHFLTIISQGTEPAGMLAIAGESASFLLLGMLVYLAGRTLAPGGAVALVIGIVGTSLGQALVSRFLPAGHDAGPMQLLLIVAVPVAVYAGATGWMLVRQARRWRSAEPAVADAEALLAVLGLASFAVLVPIAMALYRATDWLEAAGRASPLVALLAAPALASGMAMWRHLKDPALASLRTAGTAVAIAASLLLVAGLAAAWPIPSQLLPAAILCFIALSALAIVFSAPGAHVPAIACLIFALLLIAHLATGRIGWTGEGEPLRVALLSAQTAPATLPIVAVLLVVASTLRRLGRQIEANLYGVAYALVAAAGIGLAACHGLGRSEDHNASIVLGLYAIAVLGIAVASGRHGLRRLGLDFLSREGSPQARLAAPCVIASVLLAPAVAQAMVYRWPVMEEWLHRWILTALAYSAILAVAGLVRQYALGRKLRGLAEPALMVTAIIPALMGAAILRTDPSWVMLTLVALGLGAVWLALNADRRTLGLFLAFQAATAASIALAAVAWRSGQAYFIASPHPLLDPRTLQVIGVALGLWCIAWIGVRAIRWRGTPIIEGRLAVDHALPIALVALCIGMAAWHTAAPMMRELDAPGTAAGNSPLQVVAGGSAAWMMMGTTAAALLLGLTRRRADRILLAAIQVALVALAWGATLLLAGSFDAANASASAWRWLCAALLLAGTGLLFCLELLCAPDDEDAKLRRVPQDALLALAIAPILAITIASAWRVLAGPGIAGPAAGSLFNRIGNSVNYLTPLLATVAALIAWAGWRRSDALALAAAAVLHLAASLGYALAVHGTPFGAEQYLKLIHLNVIAGGLFALGWLAVLRYRVGGEASGSSGLVGALIAPNLLAIAAALGVPMFHLIASPADAPAWLTSGGSWLAVAAWLIIGAAFAWMYRASGRAIPRAIAIPIVAVIASLIALRFNARGGWLAYHVLQSAVALGAMATLAAEWLLRPAAEAEDDLRPPPHATSAAVLGVLLVALSMWAYNSGDPSTYAWPVMGLLAASALAVALSMTTLAPAWLYAAGVLVNVAVGLWWSARGMNLLGPALWSLVGTQVIAAAGCGLAFLFLELTFLRPARHEAVRIGLPDFHQVAAIVAACAIAILVAFMLLLHGSGWNVRPNAWLMWIALGTTVLLGVGCLWDGRARFILPVLYATGLASAGLALDAFRPTPDQYLWIGALVVSGWAVMSGFLFTQRQPLARALASIGIQREDWPAESSGWLSAVTLLQAAGVLVVAAWAVDTQTLLTVRLAACTGGVAMAVALGSLAAGRGRMRECAIVVAIAAMILWGWAWIAPERWGLMLLNRLVIAMLVLAGATLFCAVGMVKFIRRDDAWHDAARRLVPWLAGATAAALAGVLAMEAILYDAELVAATRRGVPMDDWSIAAVALALVALAAGGIVCAAVPGKDPLDLPDRTRTAYVYGAELLLVLLFVHVKLCVPDLLNISIWNRYWPAILMLLAYLGVGLGELFRRQERLVLAQPLENSAALLPVLPVGAYWLLDNTWAHARHVPYPTVLLACAAAYAAMAFLRRSFILGVLAAIAANGALWWMLHHTDRFGFAQHPQLWLIPAAGSVLAAAWLNRDRLGANQMRFVRYACLIVIYASSTADIFLNGIRESPHLALILALLAMAGILAGIALRVQSFLFLGSTFLVVSLATLLRCAHLRLHHHWPWLVAGIVVGVLVFGLFAYFERRREELHRLVHAVKEWDR